jgi:hypothetical protein
MASTSLLAAQAHAQPADFTVPQDAPQGAQMLASHGVLTLRVARQDDTAHQIEQIVRQLGGRLQQSAGRRLDVRVRVEHLARALTVIAAVGVEVSRRVDVRDLTPDYIDTLSRLRSAEQTLARLRTLRAGAPGVQDPLRVERDLQRWESDASQMQRALRDIRATVAEATIEVLLEPTQVVMSDEIPPFQLPFPWLDQVGLGHLLDLERQEPPQPKRAVSSSAQMDLHLKMLRAPDDLLLGANRSALACGFSLRGVGETDPTGFAAGSDVEIGAGLSGGFLYDVRMLFGLGTGLGEWFALGAMSGLGISGVTGKYVPLGVDVPIELFAGVEVGNLFRGQLWGRASFLFASDARQDGAQHAPIGDELHTGVSLLLGEQQGGHNPDRTGLALTGAYRELLGTTGYEVSVGYGAAFVELR